MKEIGIESSLAEAIRSGEKTIDCQLGKPDILKLKVDDILSVREDIWEDGKKIGTHDYKLQVKITQILFFETINETMQSLDFMSIVPFAKSSNEAIKIYSKFYSKDEELDFGIVAIFFDLIDDLHA